MPPRLPFIAHIATRGTVSAIQDARSVLIPLLSGIRIEEAIVGLGAVVLALIERREFLGGNDDVSMSAIVGELLDLYENTKATHPQAMEALQTDIGLLLEIADRERR